MAGWCAGITPNDRAPLSPVPYESHDRSLSPRAGVYSGQLPPDSNRQIDYFQCNRFAQNWQMRRLCRGVFFRRIRQVSISRKGLFSRALIVATRWPVGHLQKDSRVCEKKHGLVLVDG